MNSRRPAEKLRVLATDLDGTLIPLPGDEQNRADLERLRGYLAVNAMTLAFVTGRHLAIAVEVMAEHELPRPDWIICDVGTTIYREATGGWEEVAEYHEHLAAICATLPIDELRRVSAGFEDLTLQEAEKQGAFKLSFYTDRMRLEAAAGEVRQWLAARDAPYSLISSVDPFTNRGLIDVLPREISKAYAIEWWRQHCGFAVEQIVFAGDTGNDFAALVAGYRSIVVGNAEPALAAAVREEHRRQGFAGRLYLATGDATSGLLEGLQAFGVGRNVAQPLRLGATPLSYRRTEFAVWAPRRERVDVEIERDGVAERHRLDSIGEGCFGGIVEGIEAGARYAYCLDDGVARPDPRSRFQPEGVHGPSQVVDPNAFEWRDDGWMGVPRSELVIYELHVGTFTQAGTFRAAAERLDELRDLGVTAIELMPVAQTPGRWNWGYDGVDLFAPSHHYGTPDDFRALVDAAHAAGLAVILDVVYNHAGPEGNYLGEYGPYFSTTHHTPWGEAFNFDGPDGEHARRFVVENAVAWLDEYHLDGLRLDAVHCMHDHSDDPILDAIRRAVTAYADSVQRHVHLIAESNVFDGDLLRESAAGCRPYDAIWCDDIMHAIYAHVAPEVKNTHRHYQAGDLPEALRHGYLYAGPPDIRVTPVDRERLHPDGTGADLESFVIALQNHDVVGNEPQGRRFHQVASPEAQKAAAALVLLYPTIPLIFMGEEFAAGSPFRFFTDFEDEQLRAAVERGRTREYPGHQHAEHLSPLDPAAFTESRLAGRPDDAMRDWYRALLRTRRQWRSDGVLSWRNLATGHVPAGNVFTLSYRDPRNRGRFVIARLSSPASHGGRVAVRVEGTIRHDSRRATSRKEVAPGVVEVSLESDHALVGEGQVTTELYQ